MEIDDLPANKLLFVPWMRRRPLERHFGRVVCSRLPATREAPSPRWSTPSSPPQNDSGTTSPEAARHAQRDDLRDLVQAAAGGSLATTAFLVIVPNDFTREWIESHFLGLLRAATRDSLGREVRVALSVAEARAGRAGCDVVTHRERQPARLERSTFDNFVIGSSNRFAHAAALAVAEAPAQAYNPLFIYGGTGLGKTHLLQAIGAYVSDHAKKLTTRYVTSETFTNDFINSLRDKRIEGFKHRYRAYDVLLVDDIQFLEGKALPGGVLPHLQLALRGRPADRHLVGPAAEGDRDARGTAALAVRVGADHRHQPPDLETRIAILRKKVPTASRSPTRRSDLHRRARLHEHPRARGRAHARRRVLVAHRPAARRRPGRAGAARPLPLERRPSRGDDRPHPGGVCERFSLTVQELCSQRRSQAVAYPRQVAMYLSREPTDASLPKIGKEFGGRDHDRHPRKREDHAHDL